MVITAKRDGVERARFFVKAKAEIFGNGARAGAVVERHHENADENHRGNRANPIKMTGGDSIFRAAGGHADNFLRAEIRGNKCEAANPCGKGASGKEKIGAGFHVRFSMTPMATTKPR